MLFSSSYFVTQIKKKKENVSSLRTEQGDRAMMIFIILYTDAGSFIFFASVCLSCPPLPPLPLSLSVLTGTSRLSLFADLSWGVDSSHTTWCHSSVKLRRNRHDYQNYTAVICASEEGLLHQLCYISPASVQTTCSSYIVAVSSSFSNSCKVRLICYLIDWHIMFHGYLLGSEKCSNPAKHWRCSLVIIAAFTWQDACVCLEVHNRCAGHNLVPSSDQAKM